MVNLGLLIILFTKKRLLTGHLSQRVMVMESRMLSDSVTCWTTLCFITGLCCCDSRFWLWSDIATSKQIFNVFFMYFIMG